MQAQPANINSSAKLTFGTEYAIIKEGDNAEQLYQRGGKIRCKREDGFVKISGKAVLYFKGEINLYWTGFPSRIAKKFY